MKLPLVTFGFVNCNRLHYLFSNIESLLHCTSTYPDKELIVVDNASVESGTKEYLETLRQMGVRVFVREKRDCKNEFARALNTIVAEAKGEFIVPMTGDSQFVVRGQWLHDYVSFYSMHHDETGCIILDAQRRVTNVSHRYEEPSVGADRFVYDLDRPPVAGAANVMYSRDIANMIYPWDEDNERHEYQGDSETKMLQKVNDLVKSKNMQIKCAVPRVPPMAGICTDPQGTNARIRGNKRYGVYFAPKVGFMYYEIRDEKSLVPLVAQKKLLSIEDYVMTMGFPRPVDAAGNWLKNPIRPETASPSDYVIIDDSEEVDMFGVPAAPQQQKQPEASQTPSFCFEPPEETSTVSSFLFGRRS